MNKKHMQETTSTNWQTFETEILPWNCMGTVVLDQLTWGEGPGIVRRQKHRRVGRADGFAANFCWIIVGWVKMSSCWICFRSFWRNVFKDSHPKGRDTPTKTKDDNGKQQATMNEGVSPTEDGDCPVLAMFRFFGKWCFNLIKQVHFTTQNLMVRRWEFHSANFVTIGPESRVQSHGWLLRKGGRPKDETRWVFFISFQLRWS